MKNFKNKFLIMNRAGIFDLEVLGDSHCGINNQLKVKYVVKVECAAKVDERGFLFDQLTVDQFFQKLRRTKLSCERLSESCAKKLLKVIHHENPSCEVKRMELTISPEPFAASMTYCLEA